MCVYQLTDPLAYETLHRCTFRLTVKCFLGHTNMHKNQEQEGVKLIMYSRSPIIYKRLKGFHGFIAPRRITVCGSRNSKGKGNSPPITLLPGPAAPSNRTSPGGLKGGLQGRTQSALIHSVHHPYMLLPVKDTSQKYVSIHQYKCYNTALANRLVH